MNNEFEWRQQMRKLGGPVEPAQDLWPAIAARVALAGTAPARRSRPLAFFAIAATVVAAVGAALMVSRGPTGVPAVPVARAPQPAAAPATAAADMPRGALEWAVPEDPALAASARNLDDASAQLQGALEQRPDAVFLVGLLNRTNAQRLRLMRKSPYSG